MEERWLLKEQEEQRLIKEAIAIANCDRAELAQKEALVQLRKGEGVVIPALPQVNAPTTPSTHTPDGKDQEGSKQDHRGNN